MGLHEIIEELEKAYLENGDIPLDGDLLDLAVIAFELSKMESDDEGKILYALHEQSPHRKANWRTL